ncbi:MAG TPA: hypothetical protein VH081_02355 [Solirubrobacteraceae bacterium]|nr:hypothetical protein [Solirubrobacteraceae bacterium]
MSKGLPIERIARARAVADAPVEALLERAEELARRWVIAQLAARPLQEMADVPVQRLARDAPAFCEQLVRALASDAELERLLHGEAPSSRESSLGGIAGGVPATSGDASAIAASFEALRAVVWRQALAELRDPPVALVGDLADRLAFVCAAALAAALDAHGSEEVTAAPSAARAFSPAPQMPRTQVAAGRSGAGRGGAVLIDELDDEPAPAARRGRARPWDTPLEHERSGSSASAESGRPRIFERDALDDDELQMRVTRSSRVQVDELR